MPQNELTWEDLSRLTDPELATHAASLTAQLAAVQLEQLWRIPERHLTPEQMAHASDLARARAREFPADAPIMEEWLARIDREARERFSGRSVTGTLAGDIAARLAERASG